MQYEHELDYAYEQPHVSARTLFIRRTYAHLAGAILAFIGVEALLLNVVPHNEVLQFFMGSRLTWLFVLLAFMGASYLAQMWARSETSVGMQYLGLGLYVVAEAVIFLPLLIVATYVEQARWMAGKESHLIAQAGLLTLGVFAGLTMTVFLTKKDYSFLAPVLSVCTWVALGVIVAGLLFGFTLGLFFCFAMVALMSGFILYQTSLIMRSYPTHLHVSAALMLFSSVATMFWYILQILMELQGRD
jgi:FtsH-binding integral membrane protein